MMRSAFDDFFKRRESFYFYIRLLKNFTLSGLCIACAFFTLLPLLSLLFLVLKNGLPLMSIDLFTKLPPAAGTLGGGIGNAIIGTAIMVSIALLLATPLGILSAIYIQEYQPEGLFSKTVRFVAKLLTGIPSIICGVFAFAIIVLTTGKFSALAGSVALAVLILPTILLTTEQALGSVPKTFREASYGLGATISQTIWKIVLPEALPAIMTGIMLAIARAAGETAPVLFTALFSQYWARSLMEPTASLSVLIYNFSSLPYPHQLKMAWAAALILLVLVTLTNLVAQHAFSKRRR